MTARILDGSKVAAAIRSEVAEDAARVAARLGRPPGLNVIQVGEDPASTVYIRNKARAAELPAKPGIYFFKTSSGEVVRVKVPVTRRPPSRQMCASPDIPTPPTPVK